MLLMDTSVCWALRHNLLCYFPKQNYVTDIMLCNAHAHKNTFSCLDTHPPAHMCTCAHAYTHTHLVLLQGSLLLHVRTVFAGYNSFDISHRHCREDRSELTTTTTSLWQLCHPRWVAGLFQWLKLKISRSVTVQEYDKNLTLTLTPTVGVNDSYLSLLVVCFRPMYVFIRDRESGLIGNKYLANLSVKYTLWN